MRRSIATVSMSGTLRQKLDAIAAARFDAIELFENDFINFNGSARELRAITEDLGLGIDLYQPLRDFEGVPDAQFRRNLDRAERKFDLMQEMGAPLMLVCSNTSPLVLPDEERAASQLRELAERAARRNLRVGYEALAWGRVVKLYAQAWSIVERAGHPHLGLILDSFHTLSLRDDPAGILTIPGERIFFVQMADAPLLAMDVLQWARHHRCFPGQGQFDLVDFFEKVLRAGYTGSLSLEIFNDVFRETPNRRTALDGMRSLLLLESQVRERLRTTREIGTASSGAEVLESIELYSPPALPELAGVSFVEFAVDETAGAALGLFLEQLGFRKTGQHRSKAVWLYRQGDIRIVVNAQPNSEARARFDQQGTCVCALALETSDADRAVNRATALLSARFDAPLGPNERRVPAIVAPGGTLVHFVQGSAGAGARAGGGTGGDAPFEADFVPQSVELLQECDAGLRAIDHLAFGLSIDQIDTWILFCRAVLGMEPGESLELADPFGLVRNCGVATGDRSVRFVLNVSASRSTDTARAASASRGASVMHVALSSDDIFSSVERLQANGVPFVRVSDNYYDDLLARYDIAPQLVARMRLLGILFDRSDEGDFFHIYSESFAGRVAFEVVQRVGGYDAYGALNAPARIAAQAQQAEAARRAEAR